MVAQNTTVQRQHPNRRVPAVQPPTLAATVRNLGWFAVVGGLLLGVDIAAHLFVDDTNTPEDLIGLPHELWHLPGTIGIVAVLAGLIGVHLRQAPRAGRLGGLGFILLLVGVTLGAAYSTVFHAIFLPALENLEQGSFERFVDNTTTAQLLRGIVVQAIGLGLGAILFGAATIRAGVLPRIGGWIIIAAAVLAAANQAFDAAQLISRTLFALAFVVLGTASSRR